MRTKIAVAVVILLSIGVVVEYFSWGGGSLEKNNLLFDEATMWNRVISSDPEDIKFLDVRQCTTGRPSFHVLANAERMTFDVHVDPESHGTRIAFRPTLFYALVGYRTVSEKRMTADLPRLANYPDYRSYTVTERHVRADRVLITVPTQKEYEEWTQRFQEARVQVAEARHIREQAPAECVADRLKSRKVSLTL